MAGKVSLSLVLGGIVASSLGAAFRTAEGGIDKLKKKGDKAKVLQSTIGETMKLQSEWKRAHETGAAGADKLLRKLNGNLDALRKQGIEVGRLGREYQRLGREAQAADLKVRGREQIGQGVQGIKQTAGRALALSASLAVPTKISGDYQAQVRQMALWAHIAGEGDEKALADQIAKVAADVGMGQQALATAVAGLIEKGIDWQESVDYAPLIADLVDGQGMEAQTIATLFSAFKEAGVKKEDMGAMLGQVAAAGDIGAFGPKDMAKYMPSLLGTIKTLGMEGPEAVRFLGASLQSQYKQTQDSAAAATNMNNLLTAVISSTSQERFAKEGIDLAGSIARATKTGTAANPVEAFIKLTDVLLKKQNPTKFKEVQALKRRVQESADGSAEEAQAMASLLESAGLAGIVSDQSASAGLLAQIKYGAAIKEDMATIKDTDGKAKIQSDAEKARDTSNSKWSTAKAGGEALMTSIGDAIRPLTDGVADGLGKLSYALADLNKTAPAVVLGIVGVGAVLVKLAAVASTVKLARGAWSVAKGGILGRLAGKGGAEQLPEVGEASAARKGGLLGQIFTAGRQDPAAPGPAMPAANDPQRVFVVNAEAFGGPGQGGPAGRSKRGRKVGRVARRRVVPTASARVPRTASVTKPVPAPVPKPAAPVAPLRPGPGMASFAGEPGRLGSMVRNMRGVTRLAGNVPGGRLVDAIPGVLDTALNAQTRDEKAEGYGGVAGSMAGAWAGGAAGAAIGSFVPIIGTAIGGAIGMALGGLGGDSLGRWLGKSWFGEDRADTKRERAADEALVTSTPSPAPAVLPASATQPSAAALPTPVLQVSPAVAVPAPVLQVPPAVAVPAPVLQVPPPVAVPGPVLQVPPPVAVPGPVLQTPPRSAAPTLGVHAQPQASVPDMPPAPVMPAPVVKVQPAMAMPPAPSVLVAPAVPSLAVPAPVVTPLQTRSPVVQVASPAVPAAAPTKPATVLGRARQGIGRAMRSPRRESVPTPPAVAKAAAPVAASPVAAQPVPDRAEAMGDVVRALVDASTSQVPPAPPVVKVPPPPKAEAPKVDNTYTFHLSMPVTIAGDVKDPYQLVRDMENPLRAFFERVQREFAGRQSSTQLFDLPHV